MTAAAIPEGSVVITPIEMYREIKDMNTTVQSMAGKLDAALSGAAQRMTAIEKDAIDVKTDVTDHETRVRTLEKTSATKAELEAVAMRVQVVERSDWKKTGAAAVVAALLSSGAAVAVVEAIARH